MGVVKVFDDDALVVEPHELTAEDREAISKATAECRKQYDCAEVTRQTLDFLKRNVQGASQFHDA